MSKYTVDFAFFNSIYTLHISSQIFSMANQYFALYSLKNNLNAGHYDARLV